jgi:hypothetical protein
MRASPEMTKAVYLTHGSCLCRINRVFEDARQIGPVVRTLGLNDVSMAWRAAPERNKLLCDFCAFPPFQLRDPSPESGWQRKVIFLIDRLERLGAALVPAGHPELQEKGRCRVQSVIHRLWRRL